MGTFCDVASEERKQLLSLFVSRDAAIDASASVIEDDLDLKAESLAREDDDVDGKVDGRKRGHH